VVVVVIIAIVLVVGFLVKNTPTATSSSTTTSEAGTTADCSKQADRIAFIDSMIDKGYWQRIEAPTSVYRVFVLPAFMREVTFDDKQQYISVVSAYSICKKGEPTVGVYDSMTGKRIGRYDQGSLHLD
jgi:hypothetical protein